MGTICNGPTIKGNEEIAPKPAKCKSRPPDIPPSAPPKKNLLMTTHRMPALGDMTEFLALSTHRRFPTANRPLRWPSRAWGGDNCLRFWRRIGV